MNPATGAMLSGVRVMGCLTVFLAVIGSVVAAYAIGPLAFVFGGLLAIVGIAMAMVTRVR